MLHKVSILPAFEDNYLFCIENTETKEAIAIDPGDGEKIDKYLAANKLKLVAILNTHHHWDHKDGNPYLVSKYSCPVYTSSYDKDRIPHASIQVNGGDQLNLIGMNLQVLDLKGHTLGHIGYYMEDYLWLFCGDTLFSMGCGRLFEGSPKDMWESLNRIQQLPQELLIFCAHEYTLNNIRFCKSITKNLKALNEYQKICEELLTKGEFTIPTKLSIEIQLNPFLQCKSAEDFANLRRKKDQF